MWLDGDDVRIVLLSVIGDVCFGNNFNDGYEGLDCGEVVIEGVILNCLSIGIVSWRVFLWFFVLFFEGFDFEVFLSFIGLEDMSELDRFLVLVVEDVELIGVNDVIVELDVLKNLFERFVRVRVVGRELVKRNKEGGGLGFVIEDEDYYIFVIGDYVMGIVVFGMFSKLDINIGVK